MRQDGTGHFLCFGSTLEGIDWTPCPKPTVRLPVGGVTLAVQKRCNSPADHFFVGFWVQPKWEEPVVGLYHCPSYSFLISSDLHK